MRAYNALVLPVLLYNCGTWGVTDLVIKKLEAFHRRQLREVIGVRTRDIHNAALYKRCGTCELKGKITHARWSLFGHVLRLASDTRAQLSMDYYAQVEDVGRQGRPVTTLPVVLFNEYKEHMMKEKKTKTYKKSCSRMLAELRELAGDRVKWRDVVGTFVYSDYKR